MTGELSGYLITARGNLRNVRLAATPRELLARMRDLIGCRQIARVRLPSGIDIWLDEHGYAASPVNLLATAIARSYGDLHQPLFGTTLFLGAADSRGHCRSLTTASRKDIRHRAEAVLHKVTAARIAQHPVISAAGTEAGARVTGR